VNVCQFHHLGILFRIRTQKRIVFGANKLNKRE